MPKKKGSTTAAKTAAPKAPSAPKTPITVTAGKLPGKAISVTLEANEPHTVIAALEKAAHLIGREKEKPAYVINKNEYGGGGDMDLSKVDIPFLNGAALAKKEKLSNGEIHWSDVKWNTKIKDGDKVTLSAKIQGN